jgi:hypothetical protein
MLAETLTTVLTEPGELGAVMVGYTDETDGDPAEIVCLLLTPWHPELTRMRDVRPTWDGGERILSLLFTYANAHVPVPISETLEPIIVDDVIHAYGLRKATKGVWALAPSLQIPGVVHCYLVFHGVPDPAPWESRIIVVSR